MNNGRLFNILGGVGAGLATTGIVGLVVGYGRVESLNERVSNHREIPYHAGAKNLVIAAEDRLKDDVEELKGEVKENRKRIERVDKRATRSEAILDALAERLKVKTPPKIDSKDPS